MREGKGGSWVELCPDFPVENVSFDDALKFIFVLNRRAEEAGINDYTYELPYETQWEYAARGRVDYDGVEQGAYCFGNDRSRLGDYAWSHQNSNDTTHAVGSKFPNSYGLYDMHGNVGEWCWSDEVLRDHSVADWSVHHVNRGGSFNDAPEQLRSASRRLEWGPNLFTGFRLVRTRNSR